MDTIFYGIGGGDMRDNRMAIHYGRIVELAKARCGTGKPAVSILPTAHFNGASAKFGRGWMDFIVEKFDALGCDVSNIWIGDLPAGQKAASDDEIEADLSRSNALFVLGGDTRYLLNAVRKRGLEKVFIDAYQNGTIFSGSSAGFIWFSQFSMSDSESFHQQQWQYIMLEGLGVLPFVINVHDNGEVPEGIIDKRSRREQFEGYFREIEGLPGLAVDEMAGIEILNGRGVVRSAAPEIGASLLLNRENRLFRRRMDSDGIDLFDPEAIERFVFAE